MVSTTAPGHPCSIAVLEAFEARCIDPEVVTAHGVYTARRPPKDPQTGKSGTPIPDIKGNVVCYPFHDENGEVCNTKYLCWKGDEKLYFQTGGGRKTFYNLPALLSPELRGENAQPALIVEGENDCLAAVSIHPFTVSVPDGGSPDRDHKTGRLIPMKPDDELDPASDIKFSYIMDAWEIIGDLPKIIIWTDWDEVGRRLRDELARRLGKVRCSFVDRPEYMGEDIVPFKHKDKQTGKITRGKRPVKDLNEVKKYYGDAAVSDCLIRAKPIPMTGLYRLSDFQEKTRILYSTGFKALDPYIQIYSGSFTVVSGVPQSGKSQLWNQIAFNMAMIHGWKVAIASFEADIKPDIVRQLRAFFIRKPYSRWTTQDRRDADYFIETHFVFITRDPEGIEDVKATPEWLCGKIEEAVIRYGINMALIDPWNQLDHQRRPGEMRDEYTISRIKMIKDTGRRLEVSTVIVAHPDKSAGKAAKDGEVMSLYDISDGAAWINAAEHGMIVYRHNMTGDTTECYMRKVKFRGTGKLGNAALIFLADEERFDDDLMPTPHPADIEKPRARH